MRRLGLGAREEDGGCRPFRQWPPACLTLAIAPHPLTNPRFGRNLPERAILGANPHIMNLTSLLDFVS